MKNKSSSGSVLIFTLIMMFMLLALAMGVLSTTAIERKLGGATGKSVVAFQVADTGAETVLNVLRKHAPSELLSVAFPSCSNSSISNNLSSGNYTITFQHQDGSNVLCTESISNVYQVKSIGMFSGASRAVQVAVAADFWTLQTGNSANVLNTNTGNVGIGTATPSSKLSIGADLGAIAGNGLSIGNASNANTIMRMGEDSGNFGSMAWEGTNNFLTMSTTAGGTSYPWTLNLKDGIIGIGNTDPIAVVGDLTLTRVGTQTGALFLGVRANYGYLYYDGTELNMNRNLDLAGCLKINDNPQTGGCLSDSRLKKDIAYLSGALDKIALLKPSSFNFIDPENGPGTQYGLIAQDVEEVFPELVKTNEKGFKTVNYGLELQMYTMQAAKELKIKNDDLSNEINQLKSLVCLDHPNSDYCKK